MADVVASSIVRFVSDKLATKVMNELGLLKGVDEELKKLKSILSIIHDVLEDAEAQQVKGKALLNWLKKLKDVAFDIDDVLDEAAVEALRHNTNEKLHKLSLRLKSIRFRHNIARKMKEIRKRLDEIADEKSRFQLSTSGTTAAKDSEVNSTARETGSFVNESEVYGREQDKEQIINFLMDESSENILKVIAFVGLGGLGKTTLAQLVYNDQQVCQHFDQRRIWVYVSQKFDTKSIIRSIIESVTKTKCTLPDSMDLLQQALVEQIRGKKFLLVLDDVWNEDYESWDGLRSLLNKGGRGSKVLATTRSTRVASIMGAEKPHLLTGLSEGDCWLLFKRRAFEFNSGANYETLVSIGKEIVKKCGGLPLAAKALGSMMRFKREVSQWLAIKENEIWRLFDDDKLILPALMLSYNHLPSCLKQCFAYCSIFPKGSNIAVQTLAQMWVAEGFVRSSDHGSTNLEDVGRQCVEQLLSRSLLENDFKINDDVIMVKMHDVVHDLARFVAGDECLILDYSSEATKISQGSRYASLIFNKLESFEAQAVSHLYKLRSLYLIRQNYAEHNYQKFVGVIFSRMKLLRALNLSELQIEALPATVNNLIHLRYLDLSIMGLETLPENIGLLHNLQSLDLSDCYNLRTLPESIGGLVNLFTLNLGSCEKLHSLPESLSSLSNLHRLDLRGCHKLLQLPKNIQRMRSLADLDIDGCDGLTSMPMGIGQLCQLRGWRLPVYALGDGESDGSLAELGSLKNLGRKLHITNLQNARTVEEAREANLREKEGLRKLSLDYWGLNAIDHIVFEDIYTYEKRIKSLMDRAVALTVDANRTKLLEDVLENLQPPQNLKRLTISGYVGKMMPGWMTDLSLPNLEDLQLAEFVRCEKLTALEKFSCLKYLSLISFPLIKCLPQLGQLPCLKYLRLVMLPAVKCLGGSELYGIGDDAFPALEWLELNCMLNLEEWRSSGTDGERFLPRLRRLNLLDCPKLTALPSTFPSVKELIMNADDEMLLSCTEERDAFPNLIYWNVNGCKRDEEDQLFMRLKAVESVRKSRDSSFEAYFF